MVRVTRGTQNLLGPKKGGEWMDDYRTFWKENSAAMTLELLSA